MAKEKVSEEGMEFLRTRTVNVELTLVQLGSLIAAGQVVLDSKPEGEPVLHEGETHLRTGLDTLLTAVNVDATLANMSGKLDS